MKKSTNDKKKLLQMCVMIFSFVYAGISAFLLIYQIYYLVRWGQFTQLNADSRIPFTGINITNASGGNSLRLPGRRDMFSPVILIFSFLGMISSMFAGLTIMDLLTKKERKELKKLTIDAMLMPKEKLLVQILNDNDGDSTQAALVKKSKLTKLQVSRVLKRLESLKVISKYPYGVTNKIILEKDVYQE